MLKSCNIHALFNNVPESPILRANPLNPTEQEMDAEIKWWESLDGNVELIPIVMLWYNYRKTH